MPARTTLNPTPSRHVEVLSSLRRRVDAAWLSSHATRAMKILRLRGELRVMIIGDRRMKSLHHRYLGDASTTDVLTFDLREQARGPIDADLFVCLDEARRRARELRIDVRRELLLYIIHGLLHAAGHDDKTPKQARAMHAIEDRVLTRLGVGATFNPPAKAAKKRNPA